MMEYLPDDPKALALLVVCSLVIIRWLVITIKNELIRQAKLFGQDVEEVKDDVEEIKEDVGDLKTTVAVHEEKHDQSEKRLDHLEDARTESKR
jgi:septal ring factor EnvC (AmiA/AmiB activator)